MFSCFLNSLPPSLCPARRVYSTIVSAPLCCLASTLLALAGLALTSKPGLPISRSHHHHPQHTLSPSPPFPAHTTASTRPLDNDSQHGRHGRDCSKRKVRGADHVEAGLQPLS